MLVPFGVEDRRIFECFEDEIVGRTDLKNSAALYGSMNAASSTRRQLMALPRPALADVAEILMVEPFRNLMDCFCHSLTPGFNHTGSSSYANRIRLMTSWAASSLFATIRMVLSLKKLVNQRAKIVKIVVLPI